MDVTELPDRNVGDQPDPFGIRLFTFQEKKMQDLKKPLSFVDQVDKLHTHGMTFEDGHLVEQFLQQINYYRFTGYTLQFRKDPNKSDLVEGTSFAQIHRIYLFDEVLRNLCRRYIEIAEIYYRTQIAHTFAMAKCLNPPHDQHYDRNNFFQKSRYDEVISSLDKEKQHYKDSLIVKHHDAKYGSKMPLWVIVELLSFSNLSKLYSTMYDSEKQAIASSVNSGKETLQNHLHCLSVLRNKCAHAARLYNTVFYPPAKLGTRFLQKHPEVRSESLFAYIIVLLKRLPDKESKRLFSIELENVLEEFKDDIDLSRIGFPENYKDFLVK